MDQGIWTWEGYGLPDRIYQVTYLECAGPYSYPVHRHRNQWEMVYVSRGWFRHRVDHRIFNQREGSFFLVRENDTHGLSGEGFSFYNLAFPLTFWEGMGSFLRPAFPNAWDQLSLAPQPPAGILAPDERPEFEACLDKLLHLYDPLAFLDFWSRMVRRCLPPVSEPGPGTLPGGGLGRFGPRGTSTTVPPPWLTEALGRARAAAVPPDLATFVSWCGCSPEHVARTVRRTWGKTPTEVLADLKVDRAAGLLVQTNRGIQEIGVAVGFPNPNYFHKCFRSRFGMTPGDYRRQTPRPHRG